MSDDIIKRLREALAAGPTPGEWACYDDSNDGKTSRIEIVAIGKTVARIYRSVPEQDLPNARLIAACSPENIAALLAEIDRLREQLSTALMDGHDMAKNEYRDEIERLTALLADRDEREAKIARERDEARAEREAMANVLPGHYYMDPPDGGDVPVLEQLRRMAKDAERYRDWLRGGANIPPESTRWARWDVRYWNGRHWNTLFAEQMDAAIDAARWKE